MAETKTSGGIITPKGFIEIADLTNEENEQKYLGRLFNVIGAVSDFQPPRDTAGKDAKCQLQLVDLSTQDNPTGGVTVAMFRPPNELPLSLNVGDIVVLYQAKAQSHRNNPLSLVTNFQTAVHIYPAANIPALGSSASDPLKLSKKDKGRMPDAPVETYVPRLYHNIDKAEALPDAETFKLQTVQASKIKKDKLCELKDVTEGTFHNLIAQVVREPLHVGDKVTLYLSDYTENWRFYNHQWDGQDESVRPGRDGDPYGYTSGKAKKNKQLENWKGPLGRKTIQVTCYEPHKSVIQRDVKFGTWVHLLNVQLKYGSNQLNLEGFLREDKAAYGNKISVDVLDPDDAAEPEDIHPFVLNAMKRKRKYEKEKKALIKDMKAACTTDKKRPATDEPEGKRLNSKQKRQLLRAQAAKETAAEPSPDLNPQVACENPHEAAVPVSRILEPATYQTTIEGAPLTLTLPFTCAKYRANVRVVDFHPPRLQDFACSRKKTEFDILSDDSGSDSDSDSESEDRNTLDDFVRERVWEWRFALCLQDVTAANEPKKGHSNNKNKSFWAVVDNQDAQLLTGLDACDLRADSETLATLREKMFILWGDLEEKKSAALAANSSSKKKKNKVGKKVVSDRPPLDSSDAEPSGDAAKKETAKQAVSNRPFMCCVRQYGVLVKEPDAAKADAGDGKRWERTFGLFGTKVCEI